MESVSPAEQTSQREAAQDDSQSTPEVDTHLWEGSLVVKEGEETKIPMENLVNPPLPDELGEAECALLRGDAIGSTTYTHRWVLKTLLTITEALPKYLTANVICVKNDSKNVSEGVEGDEHSESQVSNLCTNNVIELDEDVESAACQLWDMTGEPDVVSYLLNMDVLDILQLAKEIISLSQAPRLTEVVVGLVANLCCQAEGCEKVVESEALLSSCLAILQTTDDVPTLVEAFRLLKLLLYHATYRIPMEERSQYPLVIALKSHESMKEALVFMLKNSLNDNLLNAVFEFLESLLYLWLPAGQCYMAAHYSESGLIEGVVEVMRHFLKQWEKSGGHEKPLAVNRGVLILYSFVATPAVQIISSFDQYESLLEPVLVRYMEQIAKVENVEELYKEERAESLVYALGLCELLVHTMRHPSILLHVGKLLSLTHGGSYHYVAVRVKDIQKTHKKESLHHKGERRHRRRRSSSIKPKHRSVSEGDHMEMDYSSTVHSEHRVAINNEYEAEGSSRRERENEDNVNKIRSTSSEREDNNGSIKQSFKEKDIKNISDTLKESLTDYCVRVVKYCPDLDAVLTVVNECHVHEVQLFFQAVRSQEPTLVGQLQEQLLDSGSHNRLVTILSEMYT